MKTLLSKLAFLVVLSTTLASCDMFPPKEKDIIGVWQAEDGAQIIYREDGTCSLIHVKSQVLSEYNKKYHPNASKSSTLAWGGRNTEQFEKDGSFIKELVFDEWNYDGYWEIGNIAYSYDIVMWNNPYSHCWWCGDSIPCYSTQIKVHRPSIFSSKIDFLYGIIDIDLDEWYKFYKVE